MIHPDNITSFRGAKTPSLDDILPKNFKCPTLTFSIFWLIFDILCNWSGEVTQIDSDISIKVSTTPIVLLIVHNILPETPLPFGGIIADRMIFWPRAKY